MKALSFLLFILFLPTTLLAQQNFINEKAPYQDIKITIAADKNYSFTEIKKDSSIIFQDDLTLNNYKKNAAYWIKTELINTSDRYAEYYLSAFPFLNNTYYYYDTRLNQWKTQKGGLAARNATGSRGLVKLGLYPGKATPIFIKTTVKKLPESPYQLTASLKIATVDFVENKTQKSYLYWVIALVVMGIFFISNGYIYLIFKDRAYLYYLGVLVGGFLYITSVTEQIHNIIPIRFFQVKICGNNMICYFDFVALATNLSILIIVSSLIQFSRAFLHTRTVLPQYDKLLKYVNAIFVLYLFLTSLITYTGIFYMRDSKYVIIDNSMIFLIVLLLLFVGMLAHRKKFKPAKYFLAANFIQLIIIASLAIYFLIYNNYGNGAGFLAVIAIIFQALTFSISLAARINLLKEELHIEQEESIRLKSYNEQMLLRHELIELEKQKLQEEFDFKKRQLASTTMHLFSKNELVNKLQNHIKKLKQSEPLEKAIFQIKNIINNYNYVDADWKKFKLHFEQVHPDFFKTLEKEHPNLTAYEIRLCAYLHIQLSGKEIATLLNINPASVRKAKMRLKKKMNT